jgi:hypothetical protein
MLCSSHPLCLSVEPRWGLSERQEGQRLAARLCSHFSTRGPRSRGSSLASVIASGGGWNSRGRGSWTSYQADALDIASAVASGSAVQCIGRSNLDLGIFFLVWLRGPGRHRITLIPLTAGVASRCTCSGAIFWA